MNLQIWDTAGQEKFNALSHAFYRGSNACGLVFDLSNTKSFDTLDNWKKNFLENAAPDKPESFPFVLIGNKTDTRSMEGDKAKAWCAKNGNIPYFETCATQN